MKYQKDTCKICGYKMHIGDLFANHVLNNHRSVLHNNEKFHDFIYKTFFK